MQTGYKMPVGPLAPGEKPKEMRSLTSLPVKSLIAAPPFMLLAKGAQTVRGVAFGGSGPVARLEVSLDDGKSWQDAQLDKPGDPGAWQEWTFAWRAPTAGEYVLRARATDSAGEVQPREPRWNPGGYLYNAWDSVRCTVRA
jgi:hypothetical protein